MYRARDSFHRVVSSQGLSNEDQKFRPKYQKTTFLCVVQLLPNNQINVDAMN